VCLLLNAVVLLDCVLHKSIISLYILLTYSTSSCDAPGHIVSDVSWVPLVFQVLQLSDSSSHLGLINPTLALPHPRLSLLIHSHLEATSAASVTNLMALRLLAPVMPSVLSALQRDCPANPLHPTSMGSHLARHPLLRHSSTSSAYFVLFLASSMRFSQGTVSSRERSALRPLRLAPCLPLVYLQQHCLGTSVASPGQLSAPCF